MKILYLTPDFSNFYAALYDGMIRTVGKYADVILYGPGFENFNELGGSRDIIEVINRLYGGDQPDAIIEWDAEGTGWAGYFSNMEKVGCLKVLWSVDIHKDAGAQKVLEYIKNAGIGLILMTYDKRLETEAGRTFKSLGVPIEFYPFSINEDFYKPLNLEKKYDVSLLGNIAQSYYPLRARAQEILSRMGGVRFHSPNDGRFYREDFVRHINESRICVTCASSYKYSVPKFFEIPACGSLLMADAPRDKEFINLASGHNYAEVNEGSLEERVRYYLADENELKRVADNGRQWILKHHTHDIRAKELVEILGKYD